MNLYKTGNINQQAHLDQFNAINCLPLFDDA